MPHNSSHPRFPHVFVPADEHDVKYRCLLCGSSGFWEEHRRKPVAHSTSKPKPGVPALDLVEHDLRGTALGAAIDPWDVPVDLDYRDDADLSWDEPRDNWTLGLFDL